MVSQRSENIHVFPYPHIGESIGTSAFYLKHNGQGSGSFVDLTDRDRATQRAAYRQQVHKLSARCLLCNGTALQHHAINIFSKCLLFQNRHQHLFICHDNFSFQQQKGRAGNLPVRHGLRDF